MITLEDLAATSPKEFNRIYDLALTHCAEAIRTTVDNFGPRELGQAMLDVAQEFDDARDEAFTTDPKECLR